MADQVANQIKDFLRSNFTFTEDDIPADVSLTESGVVDSTGILEVIMFLEETFTIVIEDDDVVAENFDSIGGLTAYVCSKAA